MCDSLAAQSQEGPAPTHRWPLPSLLAVLPIWSPTLLEAALFTGSRAKLCRLPKPHVCLRGRERGAGPCWSHSSLHQRTARLYHSSVRAHCMPGTPASSFCLRTFSSPLKETVWLSPLPPPPSRGAVLNLALSRLHAVGTHPSVTACGVPK